MPAAEHLAIQGDLIWTGDYNGGVTGEFGDRAIAAVKAFQKRSGGKETGILNAGARAPSPRPQRRSRSEVGWRIVDDPVTGVRLGIPGQAGDGRSAEKRRQHWASAAARCRSRRSAITQPGTTLAAVFEQQKKEPPSRKVEYSVMRDDFFVVSGLQGLKKFYVRAQLKDDDVRGVTIMYDQAMEGIMEPVVVAMSSAFAPFPAAAPRCRRRARSNMPPASWRARRVHLTDRMATDGCHVISFAGVGNAERVARGQGDRARAVARLWRGDLKPIALARSRREASDVTLVGIGDPQKQDGRGGGSAPQCRRGTRERWRSIPRRRSDSPARP